MKSDIKKPYIILRALIIFFVFVAVIVAVQYLAYHHYSDVAEWTDDERSGITYDGEEYLLAGEHGKNKLSVSKYKMQKVLGEVKLGGLKNAFSKVALVYSVEDYENLLIVSYEDGDAKYVYYKKGTENPSTPETQTETGSVG